MQTENKPNSSVSVSSECLEDAMKRIYPVSVQDLSPSTKRNAFKAGANWQKEQYADLMQSHSELLEALEGIMKDIREHHGIMPVSMRPTRAAALSAIEKANSIINQDKKQ